MNLYDDVIEEYTPDEIAVIPVSRWLNYKIQEISDHLSSGRDTIMGGFSGVGKTSSSKGIAKNRERGLLHIRNIIIDKPRALANIPLLTSKHFRLFGKTPLIFFDEIEKFISSDTRSSGFDWRFNFLKELLLEPSIYPYTPSVPMPELVATANEIENLYHSVRSYFQPGCVFYGLPIEDAREEIIVQHPISSSLTACQLKNLVYETDLCSIRTLKQCLDSVLSKRLAGNQIIDYVKKNNIKVMSTQELLDFKGKATFYFKNISYWPYY